MEKLITLIKDESLKVSHNILKYDKPEVVYISLKNNYTLLVKENDNIAIGTPLYKTLDSVFTSPISGIIKSITNIIK